MEKKYTNYLLLLGVISYLFLFYQEVLLSPNEYLFSATGDGIKNYFTFVSQIKEDSSTISTAMNYPYGEHFLYLDCHPALSIIIRYLGVIFPIIIPHAVGIINVMMIASIGLSTWLIYLILMRYNVRPIVAAFAGFGIAVLAPQISRITGHYALSYSFFIPLLWYLTLRFYESKQKWKWSIIISIVTIYWFFTHAYLGMISFMFLFSFTLLNGLLSFKASYGRLSFYFHLFVQAVLPLLIMFVYSKWSDTHLYRTDNPYGFFIASSHLDSIIFPNHPPLNQLFGSYFELNQHWEGWAYIGIGTSLSLCFSTLYFIYFLIRYRKSPFKTLEIPIHLLIVLFASVLILLLSFAFPFTRYPELLETFSAIKNFRGIGRFAWVFYYSSTIISIIFIYKICNQSRKTFWTAIPALLISTSFLVEGIPYHQKIYNQINQMPNYFNPKMMDNDWKKTISEIDFSKYQAIIPLPFYHIGSEVFSKEPSDKNLVISMVMAYYSNLPLVANHSGRTSIQEAKNCMQVISSTFYEKSYQKDIKDPRPFLLIYTHEELLDGEKDLLNRATLINKNNSFSTYEISVDALFFNGGTEEIKAFNSKKEKLTKKGPFLIDADSSSYIYYNAHDKKPSKISFNANGSLEVFKGNYTVLGEFEKDALKDSTAYIASFWMYNNGRNFGQDIPGITLFYQINFPDNLVWAERETVNLGLIQFGDWSLVELKFIANSNFPSLICIKGEDDSQQILNINDVLIRPANVNVYREDKNGLFMNNHRIKY